MSKNNFKDIAKQTHEKFSLLHATNVFPGLYIGSMYAASDNEFLKNNNIKYILNVTEDGQDTIKNISNDNAINCIYVPMRDETNFNAIKLFPKTCEIIDNVLNARFQQAKKEIINKENTIECVKNENFENILVHCQLGISRSATVVSAYLLYKFYEYDTQTKDNIDSRKILQHILENDSLLNKNNTSKDTKITSEKTSTYTVPFDRVPSVLKYLQRKRPTIKPNEGFERQLHLWQSKLEHNYEKEMEKDLKNKLKENKGYKSTPTSPLPKKKENNRLSNSLEYLKIYSISICNDIKYKLSKKKSNIKNDDKDSSSKISKDEVAKKLNL